MSRQRKVVGTALVAGGIGLAGLAALQSSAPVLTEAQWLDSQPVTVNLEYGVPSNGPTTPAEPIDPVEDPEEWIDEVIEQWTPEQIEENIEQLLGELSEEALIETIAYYQDPEAISELENLPGIDPETGEDTGITPVLPPYSQSGNPGMDFCYRFEVTNESSDQELWWEATFDTSQPPFWGWEPYDEEDEPNYNFGYNSYTYGHWETDWDQGGFQPHTSRRGGDWHIRGRGGSQANAAPVPPQGSVEAEMCLVNVPVPPVNLGTFTYEVALGSNPGDYYLPLTVTAWTPAQTYIPWGFYVSLNQWVCEPSNVNLSWDSGWAVREVTPTLFYISREPGDADHVVREGANAPVRAYNRFASIRPNSGPLQLPGRDC
ncbi:hypothetical protein [Nesterenkonia ebinurensis]|uniref:hypothetical protein n=1 Tax=Nesterenkonia ebinurensis TaxID=2608252 RepID=UPI00123CF1E5|nr:hypothetical protein [Nesterenkonia ebinurensis]